MTSEIQDWLRSATHVVALTGAGVSAESGVPTFRGPGGLWRNFRPEELATPEAFSRDPKLVWEWYDWRRGLIRAVEPNAAHMALVRLEDQAPEFLLITQNVDGLHDRAGSRRIAKLHGDIWTTHCLECGRDAVELHCPLPEIPPRCGKCGGMLRPGVVWFGEPLPDGPWAEAEAAVRRCDVMLVIGTSAVVYPAAALVPLALKCGARVIEMNTEETPQSASVHASLRGPAGALLPELVQ